MGRDISSVVRELCLALPATEEVMSHGSPDFRVAGKNFATFCINHHGDGRVALWLRSPPGAQQLHTEMEPDYYFVPPYVGTRGWLGVELNAGLPWTSVATRVREAYEQVAPAALAAQLPNSIAVPPPDRDMLPEEIDPWLGVRAREIVGRLGELCDALPEIAAATSFGNPVWKAGKKTFVGGHYYSGRLSLQFWVGADQQALLTGDARYSIPAYMGNKGWIDLDVQDHADWDEIENLLLASYRHFALKRMLKALDGA